MENVYLQKAIEIVTAQATVRTMTTEEINSMILAVSASIAAADAGTAVLQDDAMAFGVIGGVDGKKSIKENSITCLECGKGFKVITKKHLASHGMTPEQYREKYGIKKGAALAAKSLVRERRKKMKEMKLWERKGGKTDSTGAAQ